ncbi:MAG: hypothetical protein NTW79_01225 [Candidatus Berkelbacteria bacterium]|nr:hypothetical protein [Candidatus Berkelbacteria bacterium]
MRIKTRIIFLAVLVLTIIGLWLRYYLKTSPAVLNLGSSEIIAVNYSPTTDDSPEAADAENDNVIANSAKIVADYQPGVRNFYISSTIWPQNFADCNLFWSSDPDHFLAGVGTIDTKDPLAADFSNLFSDPDYQKFVRYATDQNYDLYVSFDGSAPINHRLVINGGEYDTDQSFGQFYRLKNFHSDSNQFAGIKPLDTNYKIDRAVFVTKNISSLNQFSRVISDSDVKMSVKGSQVEIGLPENSFAFIRSERNLALGSNQSKKEIVTSGVFYDGESWSSSVTPTVNLNLPHYFNVVSHSGAYDSTDPGNSARSSKYSLVSLVLIGLGVAIYFWSKIRPFIINLPAEIFNLWQWFRLFVRQVPAEIVIYFSIVSGLLVIRTNNYFSSIIDFPFLATTIFLFFVVYRRFSIRFIATLIAILVFAIAILSQTDYVVVQRNLENIIFILLLIATIVLIGPWKSENKEKRRRNGKN